MILSMWHIWLVVAILLVIIEFMTASFGTICFAIGAVAAMLAALIGANIYVQIGLMLVCSIISLFTIRPMVMKYLDKNHQATNMDRMVGRQARVTEVIDEQQMLYRVAIDGIDWRAQAEAPVEVGQSVTILRSEGNLLFIKGVF